VLTVNREQGVMEAASTAGKDFVLRGNSFPKFTKVFVVLLAEG
jgi:hypothetical protein